MAKDKKDHPLIIPPFERYILSLEVHMLRDNLEMHKGIIQGKQKIVSIIPIGLEILHSSLLHRRM